MENMDFLPPAAPSLVFEREIYTSYNHLTFGPDFFFIHHLSVRWGSCSWPQLIADRRSRSRINNRRRA